LKFLSPSPKNYSIIWGMPQASSRDEMQPK
jgi:hypothetical protein